MSPLLEALGYHEAVEESSVFPDRQPAQRQ